MTTYKEKLESELIEKIEKLINSEDVRSDEKKILYKFLNNKDSVLKKVKDLKDDLRNLQAEKGLEDGLSDQVLDLYSFLQRKVPTSGPASIFNGLIK
ncbi:MAG: hypothetical protein SOW41_08385 [Anaerococcus sp.]|nr:hypothetical protein [Peptoniphilaceae bacterium]MDY3056054.1 hypothetical protein [Anaerococcus sp.]